MNNIPNQPTEEQYLSCIRCGLCLAVCPTYRENLNETASPRGRVALTRMGLEGELKLGTNLAEQIYACFDCLACNDICPVGIKPADLVMDMRQMLESRDSTPWKKTLFEDLIPKPERLELITLPLRAFESIGIRRLFNIMRLDKLLPGKVRDMEAMLPGQPRRPLRQVLPEVSSPDGMTHHRVGFFLGCAQSLMFADESAAGVRVLVRNGCTVITPKETVCCGMPALAYGKLEQARIQAHHNIAQFEKTQTDFVVTDCATCGSALKDYSQLLQDDPNWSARARTFSSKVMDISEFLVSIGIEKPRGRLDARVTYHDPCHLRRGQDVWKQPRELLKIIDGVDFVELPEADWCCGMAGSQLITHPETSIRVLKRKTDNIASTKVEYVASGCPSCQMQLQVGIRRFGMDVQVVHPMVLLDKAYSTSPHPGAREQKRDVSISNTVER